MFVAMLGGCAPITCTTPPPPPLPAAVDVWAFCGIHPDHPHAQQQADTLADIAGVDVVFGPCLPPDWSTYTTSEPGQRYADPDTYRRAVRINAEAGMRTVVYDQRVWSPDPAVRDEAILFWTPVLPSIAAWDMGDEFDPGWPEQWNALIERWAVVRDLVEPVTGIPPFTNHLGSAWTLDRALAEIPGQTEMMSFDAYDVPASLRLAETYSSRVDYLMCAVNALPHGPYQPTPASATSDMRAHAQAGCDGILIFGGTQPIDTPGFDHPSLVYPDGSPTPLAAAVLKGSR